MRTCLAVMVMVVATGSGAQASLLFSENWESGNTAGWVDYGYGPLATVTDQQNTTPGGMYSLRTSDTTSNNTNSVDWYFPAATEKNWYVEWSFQDTGATNEYLQILSYSQGGMRGTRLNTISFGVSVASPSNQTRYNARVRDGNLEGWMSTSMSRSNNVWHTMRVEQTEAGQLRFWVDGQLGLETSTTAIHGITGLRVGSGLSNGNKGAFYDDIRVGIVPEPAALLMLTLAAPMFVRRRRV